MKKICAWCGKILKDDPKSDKVSHGICDECKNSLDHGEIEEKSG